MFDDYNEKQTLHKNVLLSRVATPGDVIKIPTESHTHYGIYAGSGCIIHLAAIRGCLSGFFLIEVREQPLILVAQGNIAYVDNNEDCYQCPTKPPNEDVLRRAERQRGSRSYHSKFQSCKHFVDWCRFENQAYKAFMTNPDDFQQVIQCHNFNVLSTLQPGDIVEIERPLYWDMCIYIGNHNVVRVSGNVTDRLAVSGMSLMKAPRSSEVIEEPFFKAASGFVTRKVNKDDDGNKRPLPEEEIVRRARSIIGKISYQALHKNCEHFVNYCRYGIDESLMSRTRFCAVVLGSAVGGFFLGGPLGVVAATSFSAFVSFLYANQKTLDQNKT